VTKDKCCVCLVTLPGGSYTSGVGYIAWVIGDRRGLQFSCP